MDDDWGFPYDETETAIWYDPPRCWIDPRDPGGFPRDIAEMIWAMHSNGYQCSFKQENGKMNTTEDTSQDTSNGGRRDSDTQTCTKSGTGPWGSIWFNEQDLPIEPALNRKSAANSRWTNMQPTTWHHSSELQPADTSASVYQPIGSKSTPLNCTNSASEKPMTWVVWDWSSQKSDMPVEPVFWVLSPIFLAGCFGFPRPILCWFISLPVPWLTIVPQVCLLHSQIQQISQQI